MFDWIQALLGDGPWLVPILWIVGILLILGFAARLVYKTWPILSRFVNTINSLADLPRFMVTTAATLAEQDTKIAEIHHETQYNNGSSIKDSQDRTEKEIARLKKSVARVDRGVKGLYTREEIDAKTTALSDELERTRPPIRKPKEH